MITRRTNLTPLLVTGLLLAGGCVIVEPPGETAGETTSTTSGTTDASAGPSGPVSVTITTTSPTTVSPETETVTDTATDTDPEPEELCGNGDIDRGEECDDGDANADDAACTALCQLNVCGDGLVHGGVEECDDGDANADDAACTAACKSAACGDGLIHDGVEECDGELGLPPNTVCSDTCVLECTDNGPDEWFYSCGDAILTEGCRNALDNENCGENCGEPEPCAANQTCTVDEEPDPPEFICFGS